MTLDSYLLFVAASFVLCIVPGPDMLYLLSRCLAQGRKAGLLAAFGINLGSYVHLAAAVTGLSAVLATSALAFSLVKWAGAGYLIYLGCRILLSRTAPLALPLAPLAPQGGRAIFWQGFWSDVLNPKVALFFLSLLPQFVPAEGNGAPAALILLGLTANMMGIAVNSVIVLLSTAITAPLRRNAAVARWLHKAMGALFVGLGLRLVAERA